MKEETNCSLYTSTKIYLYKYSITIAYQQVFYIYIFTIRPISFKNVKSIQKEYQ